MIKKIVSFVCVSMLLSVCAYAVPAKQGVRVVTQADGTTLNIRVLGDENHHIVLSEDGYLLTEQAGIYYYADQQGNPSAIKAAAPSVRGQKAEAFLSAIDKPAQMALMEQKAAAAPRRIAKAVATNDTGIGLFSTDYPVTGDVKAIVVLVQYTDKQFTLSDPLDYFTRLMSEEGFSDYGGTGSCTQYFKEQSMNVFRPQFDVYGPITLAHNMAYYGGNDWAGNDKNPQKMVIEACQQLDATVDFTQYDTNNDGYIDNVFVFYAGQGEASYGSSNTVWPHSWNVSSAESTPYYFDGVRLDRYACSNEWESTSPDGIGTFCHEFSHVMGLPDLYATSYTSAFTPGSWSVMDYGPYNNDGRTPPAYSIYERYSLGWIKPLILDGPASVTLKYIGESNSGCIIKTSKANEFFLLENRQQKGWDTYIPGHGMLIWHVDFNQSVWNSNTVNNTASHQYVDLEEADGSQSEYSRNGDSFPGTANKTSFTDDTNPSMKTWSNQRLNLPITDITEAGGYIKFNVAGGHEDIDAPTPTETTEITGSSFTANWQAVEGAQSYEISVYTRTTADNGKVNTNYVDGYMSRNVGNVTSCNVTGLAPNTEYNYVVYAVDDFGRSEASTEVTVTTGDPTFEDLAPVALEPEDVDVHSFTALWEAMDGAVAYDLNVFCKELGGFSNDLVDFTAGVKNLPAGWSSNSTLSYANTAYSGNAVPSLRFAQDGYLESPLYTGDVHNLSFWHRGSNASESNSILVKATTNGTDWTTVATYPVVNTAGGETILVTDLPAGTRRIRIEYSMIGSGALAIDDVLVEWGGTETINWQRLFSFDNPLTSYLVQDLTPATTYYYNVVASDGEKQSRVSNTVKVTTQDDNHSAINGAAIAGVTVRKIGGSVFISGVNGQAVTVVDAFGRVIANRKGADACTITLPAKGLYVVKVGNTAYKLMN